MKKPQKKIVIPKPKVRRAPVPAEKLEADRKKEEARLAGRKPIAPEEIEGD